MDLRLFKSSCNIYADSPFCQDSLAAAPRPARGGTRHAALCVLSVSYVMVHCQQITLWNTQENFGMQECAAGIRDEYRKYL